MNTNILQFRVLGNPIAHSLSPYIHQYFSKISNIKINYEKILINTEEDFFERYIDNFFSIQNNIGLNITLPFKERAFKLANQYSEAAFYAKASNTLYLKNGKIFADNTDGYGLVHDITKHHNIQLKDKNILLLGAGGASRGAMYNLIQELPKSISIANRSLVKAKILAQDAQEYNNKSSKSLISCCTLDDLKIENYNFIKFDIIINATSIGMDNQNYNFIINDSCIHNATFAYDMIYNKHSPFLEWAKSLKLNYADGIGMLIQQAAYAFKVWNNCDSLPNTQELYNMLKIY